MSGITACRRGERERYLATRRPQPEHLQQYWRAWTDFALLEWTLEQRER